MTATERKRWVVAVDGGGSKISVAAHLCADDAPLPNSLDAARLWTFAHSGSAHPSVWPAAKQHLGEALNVVCHALTLSEAGCPVRHVLFALAGAGREADRRKVLDWARTLKPPFNCSSIACVSDIEPLIDYRHVVYQRNGLGSHVASEQGPQTSSSAASANRPVVVDRTTSVAVILGTGSMVATRDRQGQLVRAGGWGPHLGDECSGGALGVAALRCVVQWLDAGSPVDQAAPLVRAVLSALPNRHEWMAGSSDASAAEDATLGIDQKIDRDKLSGLLIETASHRGSAAALAHVVLAMALEKKNADALGLLETHLERLSWQIEQVVRRAELDPAGFELVFSGGLAANCAGLLQAVGDACRARGLSPRDSVVAEPLLAALRLALSSACRD